MSGEVNRCVTFKLYPSRVQLAALERLHDLHRMLYNAALEERIEAYRKAGKSISFADQCKSLTAIRQQDPDFLAVNAQSARRRWRCSRQARDFQAGNRRGHAQASRKPSIRASQRL